MWGLKTVSEIIITKSVIDEAFPLKFIFVTYKIHKNE